MTSWEPLIAAFILGLMGAGHCLGMCGGIAGALAFAIPEGSHFKRIIILLGYNLGRGLSYSIMGALAGFAGSSVSFGMGIPLLKTMSALLLVGMGLYLADWWKVLVYLEKAGNKFWQVIQPLGKSFLPVKNVYESLFLGLIWGWLPCGLVYSALVYAASQANVASGFLVMSAFALGTLPAVFMGGLAGQSLKKILNLKFVRSFLGLAFIAYGLWLLYQVVNMLLGNGHPMYH